MLRYIMAGAKKGLGGMEAPGMVKMGALTMICLEQMQECPTCFSCHTHALDPSWATF